MSLILQKFDTFLFSSLIKRYFRWREAEKSNIFWWIKSRRFQHVDSMRFIIFINCLRHSTFMLLSLAFDFLGDDMQQQVLWNILLLRFNFYNKKTRVQCERPMGVTREVGWAQRSLTWWSFAGLAQFSRICLHVAHSWWCWRTTKFPLDIKFIKKRPNIKTTGCWPTNYPVPLKNVTRICPSTEAPLKQPLSG